MSAHRAQAARQDADARRRVQTEFERPLGLEAGAGTGKTTVLVARIIAWVMGPGWQRAEATLRAEARGRDDGSHLSHDRIAAEVLRRVVAITFTEAAAAEMAARVAEAMVAIRQGGLPMGLAPDVLPEDTAEREARARALVAGLDQLVVRTIHAYCRRLLVAHALDAGMHPQFQVDADERALEEIAREVVEAKLVEAYGEPGDDDFLALAERELGPSRVEAALLELLRSAVPPKALSEDPFASDAIRAFRSALAASCAAFLRAEAGRLSVLRGAKRVAATAEAVGATQEALRAPRDDSRQGLSELLALLNEHWPKENLAKLNDWARGAFGTKEREALGDAVERLPEHAARLRRALHHSLALDPELLDLGRRVLGPLLDEASRAMRRRGVESYAALLRDTRDLLRDHPHTARRLRRDIDQLLVDEFQDTDRLQCEILRTLALEGEASERPGLLLVGDPKQSIYGWRSADLSAYHGFLAELRAAGGVCQRLSVNFRSAPVILDEVQRVVEPIMQAREGLQPPFEALLACPEKANDRGFRSADDAPVEHWISWTWDAQRGEPVCDPRAHESAALEARALAEDLLRLHRDHQVAWREVGLLFRSSTDFEIYLGALREAGIPYVVERDRSYYRRREIIEASALLRCVLDPHDQLALVCVLRSVLVGVPDAALIPLWLRDFPALLAALPSTEALAAARAAVLDVAQTLSSEIPGLERIRGWEQNLLAALEAIALLRRSFGTETADRFVERLRTLFLIEATESARYLGAHRIANLDRFFRDAVVALEESGEDVSSLLARLRASVSESREEEEGRPKDAAEDAVQVMTIHKAKGLDFEHVYVLQLHKGGRRGVTRDTVAVERGGRWEYVLFGAATPGYREAAMDAAEVEAAEQVRTLYVAMTRAKRRLVLAGRRVRDARPAGAATTHADLLAHRSPAAPDLWSLMAELREGGEGARADDTDTRWVFPALLAGGASASPLPEAQRELPGPSVEAIREESVRLANRRREAALHAARPFHAVASVDHEALDVEQAVLRGYGAEGEAASSGAEPSAGAPQRAIAMAVGSAVHGALEVFDVTADLDSELARCRREIDATLSLSVGPEDRDEAGERASELLGRFARGPLLARLRDIGAHVIARELPVLLPPAAATSDAVGFVSGAIDLLYRDPDSGHVVVADYKTDRVESLDELRERSRAYAHQGARYARAVRDALGLPVEPRFELWFLHLGHIETVFSRD